MLTSPRTNSAENFVPSHHITLITQPVLGARSRSRKKTTNIIVETTTSTKDQFDSMANNHRNSYNDSPPLILPINRIDTSQYQKKNNHHESSDSGLDLSLSTNSSVQFQPYSQQHILIHRPLSALNEDSNDEHQHNTVRLRCPPVNFGRNRSMEDMIRSNTHEEQQHRSSSFADERQQKLSLQQEQKMKRSSDSALLDFTDTTSESTEPYRQIKREPSHTQQHRSLNDVTNKTPYKVLTVRNESNMPTIVNNLSTTHTILRKPNTSTLKPLRKKTKINIMVEPSAPLTSSRLTANDEQINTIAGTTSSSSNQTTPRPLGLQNKHYRSKPMTQLAYYPNQEQMRAHVNRSVIERQHQTNIQVASHRGLLQQMIPFDASPSKVNNLLLRHQHQPTTIYYSNSNFQTSRQIKQTLPISYNDETIEHIQEEKRKQTKINKIKEQEERICLKQKEEFESHKSNDIHLKGQRKIKIKDVQESIPIHKDENSSYFLGSISRLPDKESSFEVKQKIKTEKNRDNEHIVQRQVTENLFTKTSRQNGTRTNRQKPLIIYNSNGNAIAEKYNYDQANNKIRDINQRSKRNMVDPFDINQINERNDEIVEIHPSKLIEITDRNNINDKRFNRTSRTNTQYSQCVQQKSLVGLHLRPAKVHFQTFEDPKNRNSTRVDKHHRQVKQWQNFKYDNDDNSWRKSQVESISKTSQIQPIISKNTNIYNSQQERETSHISNIDSTQSNENKFKQTIIGKHFIGRKSPISWSVQPEHRINQQQQQFEIHEKLPSELSISPSSHEELIRENSTTPLRTYRLLNNDSQQLIDGRYVIPSNKQIPSDTDPSSHESVRHVYATPDLKNDDDALIDNSSQSLKNRKQNYVYILSDDDNTQHTIDRRHSPSPLVHLSSNKKFYSPPPKNIITTEKDGLTSNDDNSDGWSDDSAELLYVDERYTTEKRTTNSSYLVSQQPHHYQIQQQNLLLR